MAVAPTYQRLPQEQDMDLEKRNVTSESFDFGDERPRRSWLTTSRNILVISLAFWGSLDLILKINDYFTSIPHIAHISHNSNSGEPKCSCGSTPAEAVANNCTFDPFAAAWVPESCLDTELLALFHSLEDSRYNSTSPKNGSEQFQSVSLPLNFSSATTSPFYSFPKGIEQLSVEEVSQLATPPAHERDGGMSSWVWTTIDWHHTHCLYVLLKIARARETGLGIEPRYRALGHTRHCAIMLLKWIREKSDVGALNGISEVDVYP